MTIPKAKVKLHRWLARTPFGKSRLETRIQPELLAALQKYADAHGWDRSEAARYLIARGVNEPERKR